MNTFVSAGGVKPCKDDDNLNECILKASKNAIKIISKGR